MIYRGGNSKEGLVKVASDITENLMTLNRKIADQVKQSESTKSTLCKLLLKIVKVRILVADFINCKVDTLLLSWNRFIIEEKQTYNCSLTIKVYFQVLHRFVGTV